MMASAADDGDDDRGLPIPNSLKEVSADWVAELLYRRLGVPRPASTAGTHDGITLLQVRAVSPASGFRETCHVTAKCASQPDRTHRLLVELVPNDPDLRDIIVRHNLFAKELLLYSEVLPTLTEYVRRRANVCKTVDVTFSVPKYLYGSYDAASGRGVLVLEDYTEVGPYDLDDPHLMLLSPDHVREVVRSLSTFHGICVAFRATEPRSLEELFPLLDDEGGAVAFFQEDMRDYLHEMYDTCKNFLQSVPGQEELSRWFEHRMSNPERLHRESSGSSLPFRDKFRAVVHGDLWHNNLFFLNDAEEIDKSKMMPFLMTDWQMCHVGSATNDLCFLLFSSTTPDFRRQNWDSLLTLYYDGLVGTLRSLGVSERQLTVSYEEFRMAVKASVPISLFFCGNVQDFDVHADAADARSVRSDAEDDEWEQTFRKLQSCLDFTSEGVETDVPQPEFPDLKSVYQSEEEASGGIRINFSNSVDSSNELSENNAQDEDKIEERLASSDKAENQGENDVEYLPENRGMSKVPTIATETELLRLEAAKRSGVRPSGSAANLDPRKARAVRRKLYLELYRDAASKGFI